MDGIDVEVVDDVQVEDAALVEGLPGVGHVGKLAVDQLLEERADESTLVRRIHADSFPPQVTLENGVASLTAAELHVVDLAEGQPIVALAGDHQPQTTEGHYALAETILDQAETLGVSTIYALGGVPTGELIEEYGVLGAVGDESLKEPLAEHGVEFREDEPAGGIVGISGLIVGMGSRRGLDAACLMGETSGYLVDPKSARAVLEVLEALLEFELEYESLDDRAERMEEVVGKIQEMERQQAMDIPSDEDLRYFG